MVRPTICAIAMLGAVACISGELTGGEALPVIANIPDCTQTGAACATWTYLYACYFGANAPHGGGCSAQSLCHAATTSYGYSESGFVCGGSAHSCYQGVTGVTGEPGFATLVHANDAGAGTDKVLLADLHRTVVAETGALLGGNNMPLKSVDTQEPAYLFTSDDLTCIDGWVKAGAPEN